MLHGYERTSLDAIAQDAGVTKPTIYSHFSDKQGLFQAIISHKCESYQMPQSFDALKSLAPREALMQIGERFMALIFSSEALCMHRIVSAEAVRHPEIARLFYEAGPERVKKAFRQLLADWEQAGLLRIPDKNLAIDHFFSLMKGETHFKMTLHIEGPPSSKQIKAHARSAIDLFLGAYQCSRGTEGSGAI